MHASFQRHFRQSSTPATLTNVLRMYPAFEKNAVLDSCIQKPSRIHPASNAISFRAPGEDTLTLKEFVNISEGSHEQTLSAASCG
jgi:hypothetical protein